MARFAYTALMPQMVHAGWFTGEQVAYLGAANLLGYLVGAVSAAWMADRFGAVRVLIACWLGVALSFAGCSVAQPMPVFFAWRVVSGVAGATLMVLGPSLAMAATPPQRRATLGVLMFCGVGCGALLSASIIPPLVQWSLTCAWLVITLLCLLALWWGARSALRIQPPAPVVVHPHPHTHTGTGTALPAAPLWTAGVVMLLLAYATDGAGFVPHTVFWVDYLDRELHKGAAYAATQWGFFGIGAIAGPLTAAFCAHRLGWWRTTSGAYLLKSLAIGLPLVWASFAGHALSVFLVGALSPGMAAITSGYLMQLVGPQQHKKMWGYATAGFALSQAISGYAMAWMYAHTGVYQPLFGIGCALLALGCLLVFASRWAPTRAPAAA